MNGHSVSALTILSLSHLPTEKKAEPKPEHVAAPHVQIVPIAEGEEGEEQEQEKSRVPQLKDLAFQKVEAQMQLASALPKPGINANRSNMYDQYLMASAVDGDTIADPLTEA